MMVAMQAVIDEGKHTDTICTSDNADIIQADMYDDKFVRYRVMFQ